MAIELKAERRDSTKNSVKKQLRSEGKIPAIVYGKTIGNQNVAVEEGELLKLFHHAGRNEVIQLQLDDGQTTSVMTQDVQRDPIKRQLIHVDFKEINMNEKVEVAVPIHVIGEDVIEKRAGVVSQNMLELHVRALPGHIPNHIDLDVSELQVGESIRVDELMQRQSGDYDILDDGQAVLVTINHPQLIQEEPVEEAEGSTDGDDQQDDAKDSEEES